MNKNQLFTLLIAAICFSCSPISDDSSKLPNETEIEEHLKPFVGYWDADKANYRTSHEWFFAPDKTCKYYVDETLKAQGVWDFNPTTSILATTIESHQWTVTISTTNSWAGICLDGSNSSISFTRLKDAEMAKYAIVGTWRNESGSEITYSPYKQFASEWGNVSNIIDNWKTAYVFCRFSELGNGYDGVVLRLNGRCNIDEHGKILSQDTLTMSLSYGCIIDGFLSKPEKSSGKGTYYYRVEATNEEQ